MTLSDIDAIIFDNDGVLVDSEVIHIAAERELLAEIGLVYDYPTYISRFVGLKNSDFHAELARDFEVETGQSFPADFRSRLDARVWPRMEAELKPVPGIDDLLTAFSGPIAVASSAGVSRLHQKLTLTGLFERFAPHIYSSDHVENGKPAPDLFLHAAAKLGAAPTRCMVIEDSVNGVIAGRAADMFTVGFTGGGHSDNVHADRLKQAGAHTCVAGHAELTAIFTQRSPA